MKRRKLKKLVIQKLVGILLLIVSAVILYIASKGTTVLESDATPVIVTIPLGLYMLITKDIILDI